MWTRKNRSYSNKWRFAIWARHNRSYRHKWSKLALLALLVPQVSAVATMRTRTPPDGDGTGANWAESDVETPPLRPPPPPEFCADDVNSGASDSSGAPLPCSYFSAQPSACASYSVARTNCPVACDTCLPLRADPSGSTFLAGEATSSHPLTRMHALQPTPRHRQAQQAQASVVPGLTSSSSTSAGSSLVTAPPFPQPPLPPSSKSPTPSSPLASPCSPPVDANRAKAQIVQPEHNQTQHHDPTHYITHHWNTSSLSTGARDAVAWKGTGPLAAANANNHLAINPPEQVSVHAAAAIFTHCPVSMDMIISSFITSQRSRPNRYSRMQVFRYAMRSYYALPIMHFYLFIELDTEFKGERENFEKELTSTLGGRLQHLQFTRILTQPSWRQFMSSIGSGNHSGRLVFFLQNDDHVFVDVDTSVLCRGLTLLHSEPSRYKSLYMSHWPEALRLSGKVSPPERIECLVRTNLTMLDSVQVFNLGFLHHLLVELEWPRGLKLARIDSLILQRAIYGRGRSLIPGVDTVTSMQTFFVPLRELCRKFDAYLHHPGIPFSAVPQLELNHTVLVRSVDTLTRAMLAGKPGRDPWAARNAFKIPDEWVSTMLHLYGVKGNMSYTQEV